MDKSIFKFVALVGAIAIMSFGYQNCTETGFSSVGLSANSLGQGFGGQVSAMDGEGNISGELTLTDCPESGCPDTLDINIVSNDNGTETNVGQTTANQVNNDDGSNVPGVDPGDQPTRYTFNFTVPMQFECTVILAYTNNPNNNQSVLIPVGQGFAQWGGNCGGGTGTPLVNIDQGTVKQDGSWVNIQGQCANGAPLSVEGAVCTGFDGEVSCNGGRFNYCARLDNFGSNLGVQLIQNLNSQVAQDVMNFNVTVPGEVQLEIVSVVVVGTTATTTVKCFPGAIVTFNIYNNDQDRMTCDDDGEITYDVTLIKNLSNRVIFVTQTTPFGITKTVQIDADAQDHTPSCSITGQTGDNFCADLSGTISGTCENGWPVLVSVDGQVQDVTICNQGNFTSGRIALDDGLSGSQVSIEQMNPHNTSLKCSDTVNMNSF